ncbi:metallophosphoesterase [Methanonatronarchaeum sp. AMET6-2]|uniref:metallophosphoesterase n=1 Tax=Methanonatronarchaeum sp. AMET6-2 TaxID=2933293 RepID=UPI00122360E7|nr:hypothetical protein [Methanonatronarchaeum sp. AMET6-2]RZN62285.1 MAG: phosphoesterase [Methanonatronarchaeia archaeon]UOY10193.1 hypothetical protein MU439_00720 [Methanonatronarchaeum sp. AMET6-2]
MTETNDIEIVDSCLYLPSLDACVFSDLHLGLEEELIRQGISFPLHEDEEVVERLLGVVDRMDPELVVLNGDILHSFGKIWGGVSDKLYRVLEAGECVLIEGSHDRMLPTLLEGREPEIHSYYEERGVVFLHGDNKIEVGSPDMIIIGHEHPAIEIEGRKLDCFLVDRSLDKPDLILTPSFSPLTEGVSINRMKSRDFMSPYMRDRDIEEFEVYVEVDGEVLRFPEIGRFRQML